MPGKRQFGEISGVREGATWQSRREVAAAGIHRPLQSGISGTRAEGADSIVVSGGYEDDEDLGEEIIYTGAGGKDPDSGQQIRDQTIDQPGNAGLITSELDGLPVRVIRGSSGDPRYSPPTGYRYDGLYRVARHWSETGRSGFRVWRFHLVKLDDRERAPFTATPGSPQGNTTPRSTIGVVTRLVRSTPVSEWVKRLYDGSCQVCRSRLEVPGGVIAEGAHIRPLGRPHAGPDTPDNILCLCPNHHSQFDQGGIYIDDQFHVWGCNDVLVGPLAMDRTHAVSVEHIRYHRALWAHDGPRRN